MSPYLTRKHIASTLSSQKIDLKKNASVFNAVSKIKNNKVISKTNVVNGTPRSSNKSPTKIINTRSISKAKNIKHKKDDTVVSQDTSQKCKSLRNKKVPKNYVNNKVVLDDTNTDKQESRNKKRKIIKCKTVSNSKQMSLKDSFLNQSKIKHPHACKSLKNPKDNTLVKKLSVNKRKQPVYECVSPEYPKETNSEIYEFKFDINDSKEKLPKKRKKRIAVKKTLVKRKKRNDPMKHNLQELKVNTKNTGESKAITNADAIVSENKDTVESLIENKNPVKSLIESKSFVESLIENENLVESLIVNKNPVKVPAQNKDMLGKDLMENSISNTEVTMELKALEPTITEKTVYNTVSKPIITSIKNINDKRILVVNTSQISNSDDSKPFRLTDVLHNRLTVQQKDIHNHSLFDKSLSPIAKSVENLQITSPWRPSPLLTFSQVKDVFQSTPENNKYDIVHKRFLRKLNNEHKQFENVTKAKSNLQKNDENRNIEGSINTHTPKTKNSSISRRFGTEITNIDHSLQYKPSIEQVNERLSSKNENTPPNIQSTNVVSSNVKNALQFENNILSPREDFKGTVIEVKAQVHREDISDIQSDEQKENLDPQPGPSGLQSKYSLPNLQKRQTPNEQRVLRQSNLNNFLNIKEMPRSTIIKTPHGIFNDIQSTPIIHKSVKKSNESNTELKNVFGFDDDSDEEISSVNYKVKNDKQEKAVQTNLEPYSVKPLSRLSISEIKNKLIVNKLKKDTYSNENIINEKKEMKESHIKKRNKQQIDITNFSDTFDVLSETGETTIASVSDVPLFADFEPSHFTQPPRRSYKRKRTVSYSLSEESAEEDEREIKRETKRKKTNKLKREQDKRLMEWIQNINKSFSEIDQHELVIE